MTESQAVLTADEAGGSRVPAALEAAIAVFAKKEWMIAAAIFAVLLAAVTFAKTFDLQFQRGDSAIFFQVLENIAERGKPVSQVFANTQAYLGSKLRVQTPQQFAADPLTPPAESERNMMRFHAYYIMFLIAPLARVIPSNVLLLLLDAVSFLGLLLLAYLVLRTRKVDAVAALLFCALVVVHPAWSQGLFYGQFYPDRLFILIGFAYMCLMHQEKKNRLLIGIGAAVCMLAGERAAITAGLFTILYALLYWKRAHIDAYFKLGVGAAMLVYGELLVKVVLANSEYSSFLPTSISGAFQEFANPVFAEKALMLLLVCAPFLLIALFSWRAASIAAVLLLPNILGNIGGAEKVGWASHYPSYYFPSLIWAAMLGFEVAYTKFRGQQRYAFYALAVLAPLFVASIGVDQYFPIQINPTNIANAFPFKLQKDIAFDLSPAGKESQQLTNAIRKAVPEGVTVTTVEEGMPILYRGRTIRFLPVDVDRADYALMYFSHPRGQPMTYFGVLSFLGQDVQDQDNRITVSRMKRDGYDFAHAQYFPASGISGIVVVKRL